MPEILMSLMSTDNIAAYALGSCKEYALDCVQNTIRNSIYTSYKKVSLGELKILVHGATSPNLVYMFEDNLGIPKTIVDNGIFTASKRWLISPPMLSLYLLLIRVGRSCVAGSLSESLEKFYEVKVPDYYSQTYRENADFYTDSNYMKAARKGIEAILTFGDRLIFGEDMLKNWTPGPDIHNRGIISFSTGALQKSNPSWYKRLQ